MLIIAGHLEVDAAERDSFVAGCVVVVRAARAAPGCLEFSITADSVDSGRIRVYERWESEDAVLAFRGSGPSDDPQTAIISADVKSYTIAAVGRP